MNGADDIEHSGLSEDLQKEEEATVVCSLPVSLT